MFFQPPGCVPRVVAPPRPPPVAARPRPTPPRFAPVEVPPPDAVGVTLAPGVDLPDPGELGIKLD